ncbi:MAG: O-antigen ligase family protein [Acidobacteriota bacterium]
MSLSRLCDRILRWGLVALIAFTPLAFGTVEGWSIAVMEWGIVSLLLLFGLDRFWPGRPRTVRRPGLWGLGIPIVLFLLLAVLQTVPIPLSWLEGVSPGSARMYDGVDLERIEAAYPQIGGDDEVDWLHRLQLPARRPVSVHPEETWKRIRLLGSLVALFFLVALWVDNAERVVFVLSAATIVGFLVGVHGLVQHLTWNGKIYWVRKVPPSSPFGPFVNHNHFAGYVEMLLPVVISLAFFLVVREGGRAWSAARPHGDRGLAAAAVRLSQDPRWGKGSLALFVAVILVVALLLSKSRGGILSALAGGLILFVLIWKRIASRRLKWIIAGSLPAVAATLVLWIQPDGVLEGLGSYGSIQTEASFRQRLMVWRSAAENLPRFVWVGSGLGTFESSFAPFTPPGTARRWDKAHNDYLQILWETGVVGFGLVAAGGLVFVRRYWWAAVRGRGESQDLLRLGIAVSLLSIALHSIVDFNLQIGANGFLCAVLAGVLVSLRHVEERARARPVPVGSGRAAT